MILTSTHEFPWTDEEPQTKAKNAYVCADRLEISIVARPKAAPPWKSRKAGERALRYVPPGVLHNGGALPGSASYTYDAAGNRLTKTAVQEASPSPVSVLSQYSYDNIYELTHAVINAKERKASEVLQMETGTDTPRIPVFSPDIMPMPEDVLNAARLRGWRILQGLVLGDEA